MRLRVLVYNVSGFRRGVGRVAAVVDEHAPDLVLLNECGSRWRLRRFAETVGMQAASGRLVPRMARLVRNAVLVRPPWRLVSAELRRFDGTGRAYPRGAMVARLGRAGFRMHAASIHLGLSVPERRGHAEEVTDLATSLGDPVLVGGDLNDTPDGPAAGWIGDRLWDVWARGGEGAGATFPSAEATARIDYLFASEHFGIERAVVLDGPEERGASDHLPLLADLSVDA